MATLYVDIIGAGFVQGIPETFANSRVYYDSSTFIVQHVGPLYTDWPSPPPPDRTGISVTVTAFGAAGNWTADDTLPIQNAIHAVEAVGMGSVVFPPGTYRISSPLLVDHDNIALIGLGQRGSAPTIQIGSSSDPTYALIVGNTKIVQNCLVQGLYFSGRANNTSTGGGIHFTSIGGKISQVQVAQFGGKGIYLDPQGFGTLFEIYINDLDLVQNGRNVTTHDDNFVSAVGVADCEFHRIIAAGNSGKTTSRNGFNVSGGALRFIDCHAYFNSNDGIYINNVADFMQIVGGEYETNGANGIEHASGMLTVSCIGCYANGNSDILSYSAGLCVQGCTCSSAASSNIYFNGASGAVIANNNLSRAAKAVWIDIGGTNYSIHDNICSSTTSNTINLSGATHGSIHDNKLTAGTIVESGASDSNNIHDNEVQSAITLVGTHSKIRANQGHNPIGQVTAPSFPATTVASTNNSGYDITAFVANGTSAITVIQLAGAAGTYVTTGQQIAANGWGAIRIPAGGSVKFTYGGGTPTWTWFGD